MSRQPPSDPQCKPNLFDRCTGALGPPGLTGASEDGEQRLLYRRATDPCRPSLCPFLTSVRSPGQRQLKIQINNKYINKTGGHIEGKI